MWIGGAILGALSTFDSTIIQFRGLTVLSLLIVTQKSNPQLSSFQCRRLSLFLSKFARMLEKSAKSWSSKSLSFNRNLTEN